MPVRNPSVLSPHRPRVSQSRGETQAVLEVALRHLFERKSVAPRGRGPGRCVWAVSGIWWPARVADRATFRIARRLATPDPGRGLATEFMHRHRTSRAEEIATRPFRRLGHRARYV